jgi:hypothetical protein
MPMDDALRHAAEVDEDLATTGVDLVVRRREDSAEFYLPVTFSTVEHTTDEDQKWLSIVGTARLSPSRAAGGTTLWEGVWDIYARVSVAGYQKEVRVGSDRSDAVPSTLSSWIVGNDGLHARPYWTKPHGNLSLEVTRSVAKLRKDLRVGAEHIRARREGGRKTFEITLPIGVSAEACWLILSRKEDQRRVAMTAAGTSSGTTHLAVAFGGDFGSPPPGRWRAALVVADVVVPLPIAVRVSRRGTSIAPIRSSPVVPAVLSRIKASLRRRQRST